MLPCCSTFTRLFEAKAPQARIRPGSPHPSGTKQASRGQVLRTGTVHQYRGCRRVFLEGFSRRTRLRSALEGPKTASWPRIEPIDTRLGSPGLGTMPPWPDPEESRRPGTGRPPPAGREVP